MEAIRDERLAQRLRSTADGMKSQIEAKLHPAIGKQRLQKRAYRRRLYREYGQYMKSGTRF